MTSLAAEQAEQRRWRFLPRQQPLPLYDQLLQREFIAMDHRDDYSNAMLAKLVPHAVAQCPYYADVFARLQLTATDIICIGDLRKLPVLTRRDLLTHEAGLAARRLPPGDQPYGVSKSSGSTGRATCVATTVRSNRMFTFLYQRRLRWMRCDPMGTLGMIRPAALFPHLGDGHKYAGDGEATVLPRWPYVGHAFRTGAAVAMPIHHGVETHLAWLAEHRVNDLITYSGVLEELAFAATPTPLPELRGISSIASQLTEPMRHRIEGTLGAPVTQTYGLNEIGMVAIECDAHRFHVNTEHCIVEIVDAEGQPRGPGEAGLIVVTGMQNAAMPLLRYDTDDTAQWSEGPCPCGRTSPTFEALSGRMRRYATLPAGTRPRLNLLTETLENAPADLLTNLRRYQIHQSRDNAFELRLVASPPVPAELVEQLHNKWRQLDGAAATPLNIVHVPDIPLGPGGKRLDFVSDFWLDMEAGPVDGGVAT